MRYTNRGAAALKEYLARVERGLAGRAGLDVADVVAGIREHVDAELTLRGVDVATVEHVTDVLERLGPPESIDDAGGAWHDEPAGAVSRGPSVAVLVVTAFGIALLPTRYMPVGLALLLIGAAGARLVLDADGVVSGVEGRAVGLVWQLFAVAAAGSLLLGPAVLVWASVQVGGVLETPLARYVEAAGRERPLSYWGAMLAVAAAVTGAWWILLGYVVRRYVTQIDGMLGPAARVLPLRSIRFLPKAGAVLLLLSFVGALLS